MNIEDLLSEKKAIVNLIEREIITTYNKSGYSEFTLFSFGSCNSNDMGVASDVDMTLLLDERYLSNSKTFENIRIKLDEIEKKSRIELHLHIGGHTFADSHNPKAAIPSGRYGPTEGWGDLANHYRLFYVAMTGKTEAGKTFIENLKFDPYRMNIPKHEGEELYAACRRDAIDAFLKGMESKENNDKDGLKRASNKMAKAILRTVEAYRLRLGLMPSWNEETKSMYNSILENSRILSLIEGSSEYRQILENALTTKLDDNVSYNFDDKDKMGFIEFFNFFKKKFLDEIKIKEDVMPHLNYQRLKEYNLATVRIASDRILDKNLEKKIQEIYPVILMASDMIIDFVEEEYREISEFMGSKDDSQLNAEEKKRMENFTKMKEILQYMCNLGYMENETAEGIKLGTNKAYLSFVGRVNLLFGKYKEAEENLEKALGDDVYDIGTVVPEIYNSRVYVKLAEAKYHLGKHDDAFRLLENSVKIYPLNDEAWQFVHAISGNEDYLEIADILRSSQNPMQEIILNEKISVDGVKKIFECWNYYIGYNLDREIEVFSGYQRDLERPYTEKIKILNPKKQNQYDIAAYLVLKKQLELVCNFLKQAQSYREDIDNGRIVTNHEYQDLLKLRWVTLNKIMLLDSVFHTINEEKLEFKGTDIETPEYVKTDIMGPFDR